MKHISSIILFYYISSLFQEAEGLQVRTMSNTEMVWFCESKVPEDKRGYRHPHYCSKAIFCQYEYSHGKHEVLFDEITCPKCSTLRNIPQNQTTIQEESDCPFGYQHWDEDKQICRKASQVNCRQEELPKVKAWGRADLAQFCDNETGFKAHPHHCGKFLYCERDVVYRDLYVQVRTCPTCDKDPRKCPDGYEYYTAGGNCVLPGSIKEDINKCRPQVNKTYAEETTTSHDLSKLILDDIVAVPEGAVKTELAEKFCQNTVLEPQRFPHPESCNKYLYCWYGLYDEEGDIREKNETLHLEFSCLSCDIDPIRCPTGFKVFDSKSTECRAADIADCNSNTNTNVTNISSRNALLNESEIKEFCMKKSTTRDYPHPTDKSCTRFITCWFQQNYFEERSCAKCLIDFNCPSGYLHFDERSQECQIPSNSSCIPGNTVSVVTSTSTPDVVHIPELVYNQTGINIISKLTIHAQPNPPTNFTKITHTNTLGGATSESLLKPKSCNPKDYIQRGYCKTYFKCNRKTRFEDTSSCNGRLFWNPDRNSVHGGVCDFLKNIDNYTLFQYKKDPACVLNVAYFRSDEEDCSGTYFYNHPQRTQGKETKLECPEDLLWAKDRQTCAKCGDVTKASKPGGGVCC